MDPLNENTLWSSLMIMYTCYRLKQKKINFISLSFGFHILLDQFKQLWNSEMYIIHQKGLTIEFLKPHYPWKNTY